MKYEKIKILEKLFRENKTSPLLKTPEKDFQERERKRERDREQSFLTSFDIKNWFIYKTIH